MIDTPYFHRKNFLRQDSGAVFAEQDWPTNRGEATSC